MSARDLILRLVGPEGLEELNRKAMQKAMRDTLQLCSDPRAAVDATCTRCSRPILVGERVWLPDFAAVGAAGDTSIVWHRACYYVTTTQLHEARLARSRHEKRVARERESVDPRQVGLFDGRRSDG